MKIEIVISLILIMLLVTSCNNSSTSFAWKSVIQAPAIDTRGNVDYRPRQNDVTIKPSVENDLNTNVAQDQTVAPKEETKPVENKTE